MCEPSDDNRVKTASVVDDGTTPISVSMDAARWRNARYERGSISVSPSITMHDCRMWRAASQKLWRTLVSRKLGLRTFVTRLTQRHEGGRAVPWHVSDAPLDYLDTMLKAIVGIEIEVTRLEGKFKLSQNRSAEDRTGVVLGLEADATQGLQAEADALAQAMQAAEQRRR